MSALYFPTEEKQIRPISAKELKIDRPEGTEGLLSNRRPLESAFSPAWSILMKQFPEIWPTPSPTSNRHFSSTPDSPQVAAAFGNRLRVHNPTPTAPYHKTTQPIPFGSSTQGCSGMKLTSWYPGNPILRWKRQAGWQDGRLPLGKGMFFPYPG